MRKLFLAEQGHTVELPAVCSCFRNVTTQDSWQGQALPLHFTLKNVVAPLADARCGNQCVQDILKGRMCHDNFN